MKTLLKNGTLVLPGRQVGRGDLLIADGRIAAVGTDVPSDGASPVDCTDKLVMPGLVNCHGHTAMTLVRGLGGGLPLQRWLEEAIFPVEAKMTPEDIAAGMTWGAMEMMAGGTTCVADMYDFPQAGAEALSAAGMKGNLNRVGLAFADNVPPGRLDECVAFVRDLKVERIVADLCIHSEYLTNEKFCRDLAAANRELKRPVHLHVSETEKEHAACLTRHGKTPIAYLADLGLFDYGAYAAHGVWCTDDDFRIMAERGVTLAHNPPSNMKLGSGFARVPRAMELGVNVALGTDGCASNDNLDLFEEMHVASLIQKGLARDPTKLSAWDVIEMATVNGAKALGRSDTGEIAVGKCADLCVVDLKRPHLVPCLDVANLIVNSMHASDVEMTLVDGEIVYEKGQFLKLDAGRAEFDFRCAVRHLGL